MGSRSASRSDSRKPATERKVARVDLQLDVKHMPPEPHRIFSASEFDSYSPDEKIQRDRENRKSTTEIREEREEKERKLDRERSPFPPRLDTKPASCRLVDKMAWR